jgi:hypothetical protein
MRPKRRPSEQVRCAIELGPVGTDLSVMPRIYRVSAGAAVYLIAFALIWFGVIFGFIIVGELARQWSAATVAGILVALALALAPAVIVAWVTYETTSTGEREWEFRSVLRRRRVRAEQITLIERDEDYVYIRYDRGKITILAETNARDLLISLLELDPALPVEEELRRSLAAPEGD